MPTETPTDEQQPIKPRDLFDFDTWAAEHTAAPIRFRLFDRDWDLPGDAPAATMLKLHRLEIVADAAKRGELPDADTVAEMEEMSTERIVRELAGDDVVDQWIGLGITHRMLQAISGRLYQLHSGANLASNADDGDESEGDGEGKATPPKTKKAAKKAG